MSKFFFSDKNVSRQCNNLGGILGVKNNDESRRNCKKFLVQQMKTVYQQYGKKRPSNMGVPDFVDLLNKKSIKECVRIQEERKHAKRQQLGGRSGQRDQKPNQRSQRGQKSQRGQRPINGL